MSGNDDFVPLEEWPLLGRERAKYAVDMSLNFVRDGRYRQAEVVLRALSSRFEVDASVEEFFERHAQLDGKDCHALHQ